NQLIGCLFATKIFKSYAEHEESDRAEYEELAGEFEGIAIRLINKFYQDNPAASFLLLTRTIPEYGNNTCLQIAHLANDKNFISQRCVQELLERLWYGNLSKEFGFFKMAISLAMPFVVPFEFFYRGRVNKNYFKEINGQEKVAEKKCEEKNFVINRIDINNLKEPKDYLSRLYNFFQAPIVKFLYDKIIYMFFLTLFCYVILCDFYAIEFAQQSPTSHSLNISAIEIVLIIWVFSFLIERIHYFYVIESKIFWTKCKLFILNLLNAMYAIAIILFIVGIALRFIPNRPDCHKASRIILSLDVIFWFLNFLHVYTSVKVMGPKLIMMMKMVYELIYFIFIVLAFLMAFGISYHALNYHNIRPSLDLVKNFFLPSFFIIPQEYYTVDSLLEADTCEVNKTDRVLTDEYSLDDCVDKEGSQVALALYTIYTVFISVLMVNLLIAIFSNTIDEIQKESDKVWKFQRYSLIYEYFHKPILIPPLVVFYPLGYIIKYLAPLVRRCWQPEHDSTKLIDRLMVKFFYRFRNGFKSNLADARLERRLVDWENKMFHQYLTDQNLEEHRRIEQRLQENLDKYDFLIQKFDSILVHTNTAYSKIREINDKIENIYIQKYVQTKKNL
ncbi:transient receptor potential cation channel subfamily M member 4-like, partial [Brachionus plicatilis]